MAGAVVLTVIGLVVGVSGGIASGAVPAGTLGSLTIFPAEGDDNVRMSATTSGPCPSATKFVNLVIEGPVGPDGTAPDIATFPTSNPYRLTPLDPNL